MRKKIVPAYYLTAIVMCKVIFLIQSSWAAIANKRTKKRRCIFHPDRVLLEVEVVEEEGDVHNGVAGQDMVEEPGRAARPRVCWDSQIFQILQILAQKRFIK